MPTLWEILTKKKVEKPLEAQYCNPLELRIGNFVKIDTIDYEKFNFILTSLREVKRTVDSKEIFFADYDLLARPYEGDAVNCRLRLMPIENGDKSVLYDVILFQKISDCGFDQTFHDGLQGQQEFVEGDITYYRVNDLKDAWVADTITLSDEDNSGKVDENEVRRSILTYWDFWRTVNDEGGVIEFYVVEMNNNGFFEFWVGRKIDASRVSVN